MISSRYGQLTDLIFLVPVSYPYWLVPSQKSIPV
jgi:hypothetical protein